MRKDGLKWIGRQRPVREAARGALWTRSLFKATRNATAALGAGVLIGAIGWELLETKTRNYWT